MGWERGRQRKPGGVKCGKRMLRFNERYQRVREILDEAERTGRK